jgi:hypothetical protein
MAGMSFALGVAVLERSAHPNFEGAVMLKRAAVGLATLLIACIAHSASAQTSPTIPSGGGNARRTVIEMPRQGSDGSIDLRWALARSWRVVFAARYLPGQGSRVLLARRAYH